MTDASIEVSPNSRVQVIPAPIAAPGHCVLCGSARTDDRAYIDFGFQMDWYGAVYFCTTCFSEVASTIGWITREHGEKIAGVSIALVDENARLKVIANTQGMMLLELAGNCHCGIFGDEPIGNVVADSVPGNSSAEANSEPDESGGGEGSGSIHDTGKRKSS